MSNHPMPATGGRFTRDPKTGALTAIPEDKDEVAPPPVAPSAPAKDKAKES